MDILTEIEQRKPIKQKFCKVKRYRVAIGSADNSLSRYYYNRRLADRVVRKAKAIGLDAYRTSPVMFTSKVP